MTDEQQSDLAAEIDANIGRNLRTLREARGLSQAELARLVTEMGVLGFHQTTIARIESGQRAMRAAEGVAIARVMETNLEWLSESRANAHLRALSADLREKSAAFDEAAKMLIWSRRVAALHLDREFPYDAEGMAPASEILAKGVDPQLYEVVEGRIVSASPEERLSQIYFDESRRQSDAYARPKQAAHKQRVEFLYDEYRGNEEGDDGEHQAKA